MAPFQEYNSLSTDSIDSGTKKLNDKLEEFKENLKQEAEIMNTETCLSSEAKPLKNINMTEEFEKIYTCK